MKNLDQIIFDGVSIHLNNFSLIKVLGEDATSFLQGQSTNDINSLEAGEGFLNTVLNIQGKIEAVFYCGRIDSDYYLVVEKKQKEDLLARLDKYLIMEDVSFESIDNEISLLTGIKGLVWAKEYKSSESFIIPYCKDYVALTFSNEVKDYFDEIDGDTHSYWKELTQWEVGQSVVGKLINETRLNEYAISYSKGCFLGQEVVAKINNNRSAAYYPAFIISDKKLSDKKIENRVVYKVQSNFEKKGNWINSVDLFRDYRIEDREIDGDKVKLGYFENNFSTLKEKLESFYQYALKLSNNHSKNEEALDILDCCIKYCPELYDAYEVAGVINGHMGKFEKAIQYMDKLLEKNPKSVMAHTNKSLYFMKLGNIEKAEEEKAKATILSFEQNAKSQKEIDEMKQKEEAEISRKEKMFKQVLEIDEFDETANYGLGEIALIRGQYKLAIDHLKLAINQNKKLSNAYLKLGQAYLKMNNENDAKNIFKIGVEIAAAQGDMMPANEMQRLLATS